MRVIKWRSFALAAVLAGWTCLATAADSQASVTYLKQGWSDGIRELFYFTPQGSRIIPVEWLVALENKDGSGMFSDSENLKRYGFIETEHASKLNPYGLPIGFAIDTHSVPDRGFSMGLTCAACHTADVTVKGKTIRIDGAPAHVDMDTFYADLAAAVTRTYFDPDAYLRFARRVLPNPNPLSLSALGVQFAEFQTWIAGDAAVRSAELLSGFGRVDALTQIVNALSVTDQNEPSNLRAIKAPTSYPHLWLTPRLNFVQWNPIASSPIARNGGEVLGVFGVAKLDGPKEEWYESSLLLNELHDLEGWVQSLKPPPWDEAIFGSVNRTRAKDGKTLYDKHCIACHTAPPYRLTDPDENIRNLSFIKIGRVNFMKVGTDPVYVMSLLQRLVRTNDATVEANGGHAVVPALSFFVNSVGTVITKAMDDLNLSPEKRLEMSGYRFKKTRGPDGKPQPYAPPSFTDLKAGPLAGIWAGGPYLHNGSVPTVYELLSPVAERSSVFWTGGRELDLDKLGFLSEDAPGRFRFDTTLPGNGNAGHLYPPQGLEAEERLEIIEYLKTL